MGVRNVDDLALDVRVDMNCKPIVALLPATETRLGGIKVGDNLTIENDGTLSANVSDQAVDTLQANVDTLYIEETLLRSELPGTTQTVTFDSNGNPATITHSASGSTVRTDVFTWTSNSVTEVRTASNKQVTLTTNLATLEQTISAITEVA